MQTETVLSCCFGYWHEQCPCGPPRYDEDPLAGCYTCGFTIFAHNPARVTDAEITAMAHYVMESNIFSGGGPGGTVHWERFHEQHAYRALACWIEIFKCNEKEIRDIIMSRDSMQID